ncbi:MAG: hypothetical protein P8045_01560 [Candidatus Thiodiazotropha sp.]|jgi:hypothetical protein
MVKMLCGVLAMVILSLFLGGLALSIYENTGSIAFPAIVVIVLLMAYVSLFDELRSKSHKP